MASILIATTGTLSLLFLFLNHPLSFGLTLLIQTLITSLITGLMNYNYWFSYILFLVMVGGMLIIFIYMTSIASNEKFKFSQTILIIMSMILGVMMILMLTDQFIYSNLIMTSDLKSMNNLFINHLSMTKYLNWPNNNIMYMMFIYLLITLIMTVKITNFKHGPIRQKL